MRPIFLTRTRTQRLRANCGRIVVYVGFFATFAFIGALIGSAI